MVDQQLLDWIQRQTRAEAVVVGEVVQTLWSGYGRVQRFYLAGHEKDSIIIKLIQPHLISSHGHHPRGWNTDLSHQRKLTSYQVEMAWYSDYVAKKKIPARMPLCYGVLNNANLQVLLLEDLDAVGFSLRRSTLNIPEVKSCLNWLASLHGWFINTEPKDLWEVGSYWHLDTRPDEYQVMKNRPLKNIAGTIDKKLNHARYKTIVHGDAKVANFCFSTGEAVAAVDFQYVGGGVGVKDVAYFLGSCLVENELIKHEEELIDAYFQYLHEALNKRKDFADVRREIEQEWRELYPYAWADFHRFLDGWMPSHEKVNGYMQQMTQKVLQGMG